MTDTITLSGKWWFPHEPQKQVYGSLEFLQGEEAILSLSYSSKDLDSEDILKFTSEFWDNDPTNSFHELILGTSTDGEQITLHQCHKVFSNYKENTYHSSFKVNYIFVGHHFENEADIQFKRISVQYSYLEEWVNKPLSLTFNEKLVKKPESIPLTKMGDYKIFIDFDRSRPISSFREFTIKQNAYMEIETFKSGKHWVSYRNIIRDIQNFLNLAIPKTVYPLKIEGKLKKDRIKSVRIGGKIIEHPIKNPNIDIYITHLKIPTLREEVSINDILFSYEDVKFNIKFTLLNWLVNSSLFRSIYNNYFSTLYKDDLYIENHFLNVITAIEAHHRSKTSNIEIDEYSHKKRVESVIEGTPDIYKDWVSKKLRYSNEPILRDRLNEILEPYSDVFNGKKRINSFIYKVITNRNSLVHQDTDRNINYEELIYTTIILKIVFELCLLEDLGFEKEYIKKLINKKKNIYAFQYMKMR